MGGLGEEDHEWEFEEGQERNREAGWTTSERMQKELQAEEGQDESGTTSCEASWV